MNINITKYRYFSVAIAVTISIGLIWLNNQNYLSKSMMEIDFLDVGQGDSILIKSNDNKYMLVDGGPDESVLTELGKTIPYGVGKIDYIILTHPDMDHIGGLPQVIERYKIDKIYMKLGDEKYNATYGELLKRLKEKNIDIIDPMIDDDFILGCCVYIDFVWPEELSDFENINDASISMLVSYQNFEMFLGGDLEKTIEEQVALHNPTDIDILKVGHHGSKNSTSQRFLDALKPEIAIISSGKGNKYGHPDAEVLDLLKVNKIKVFNTAEFGTVEILTDGDNIYL